jgi:hypothetical protein
MINSIALVNGHYECRSLKQSLPILTDLLALEVIDENGGEVTVKHPNTEWVLVLHEGGADAPDKPLRNHYGVRVATNAEIEKADAYLEKKKDDFQIQIMKPRNHHLARSVHFFEPGGNWWEIESYELAVKASWVLMFCPIGKSCCPKKSFPAEVMYPRRLHTAPSRVTIWTYRAVSTAKCWASTSSRRRPA